MAEAVEGGVTGKLVPAGDSAALAAALNELLSDRSGLEELGLAGRARARKFSVSRSVELLGELYERLLGEGSSPRGTGVGALARAGSGAPAAPESLIP